MSATKKRIEANTRFKDSEAFNESKSPVDVRITVSIDSDIVNSLTDIEFAGTQNIVAKYALNLELLLLKAINLKAEAVTE